MKPTRVWALLAAALGAGVYGATVLATPSRGSTTKTVAKSTFDDLDLRGQALTAPIGPNGKTHTNGV